MLRSDVVPVRPKPKLVLSRQPAPQKRAATLFRPLLPRRHRPARERLVKIKLLGSQQEPVFSRLDQEPQGTASPLRPCVQSVAVQSSPQQEKLEAHPRDHQVVDQVEDRAVQETESSPVPHEDDGDNVAERFLQVPNSTPAPEQLHPHDDDGADRLPQALNSSFVPQQVHRVGGVSDRFLLPAPQNVPPLHDDDEDDRSRPDSASTFVPQQVQHQDVDAGDRFPQDIDSTPTQLPQEPNAVSETIESVDRGGELVLKESDALAADGVDIAALALGIIDNAVVQCVRDHDDNSACAISQLLLSQHDASEYRLQNSPPAVQPPYLQVSESSPPFHESN